MDQYEADRPLPVAPGTFDGLMVDTESLHLIRRVGQALINNRGYRDDAPVLAYRIVRKALREQGFTQAHWRALIGDDELPGTLDMPVPTGPGLFPVPPGAVKPPATVDDDDDEDRECECAGCDDRTCAGDCPRCDDHECWQCWGDTEGECDDHECSAHYPDGCPTEDLSSCCGECPVCDRHDPDHDRPDVCDQGHCHECDHVCD